MTLKIGHAAGAQRGAVKSMLDTLCPQGNWQVAVDGTVTPGNPEFCSDPLDGPHSRVCLCKIIQSPRSATIEIRADLRAAGGGRTLMDNPDDATNGSGTDVDVHVENRDRWEFFDAANNKVVSDPDWMILGHELCGHARGDMEGNHPEWRPGKPGYRPDWHDDAIAREDELRDEHNMDRRGNLPIRMKTP